MSQLPAQSAGTADPDALFAQILGVLTQPLPPRHTD